MDANASENSRFTWLLIAAHLALAIPLAYLLNIWADEASTLHTTQNGLIYAFQRAATDERQAPLYFWILGLWRDVNGSIFFARLFSIICSAAAIKAFSGLASRLFERRAAMLVTAFFALHPLLIWASLEIRVYSLVILLSVVLVRYFLAGFDEDHSSTVAQTIKRSRIVFLVITVFSLYVNYYLGFLFVAFFTALIARQRWRPALDYALLIIISGVAFLPVLLFLRTQFEANTSAFQDPRSLSEALRYLWHHVITFVLPAGVFPEDDGSIAILIRLAVVRIGIVLLIVAGIVRRKELTRRTLNLAIIATATSCCFIAAYFVMGPYYVELRHASVMFVPPILFMASFLADVFSRSDVQPGRISNYILPASGLLVLISFSYSLLTLYPETAKRGDWARVGEYIGQNETAGQPIIVFTTFEAMALPYDYSGVNHILPDTRLFDFDNEAEFGTENSLRKQTEFVISTIPPDANEIWLAVSEKCLTTRACVPLENFVEANYTVIQEKDFYREKVRLLRKKPQ